MNQLTDPAVGGWHIFATPTGVRCIHPGDPQVLAGFVRHAVHVAQATEGLRRRAERDGVLPRPTRGDLDPAMAQLRDMREAAGVTAATVDRLLRMRIRPYETGEVQPPIGTVRSIAYLFAHNLELVPR